MASVCDAVPPLLSTFVDAFVDYAVAGLFFPSSTTTTTTTTPPPPPTFLPAPSRLVAIGDLHGDLPKSLNAFSLAGLADPSSLRWTAGPTIAVQVGDVLDRGPNELRLLYLLHRLKLEAARAGGALLTLHGNHEIMNMEADFRFITPAALQEFSSWGRWFRTGLAMKNLCLNLPPQPDPFRGIPTSFPGIRPAFWEGFRARIAALRPAGPIATRFLSGNQTVVVVGDSVFVHGGLLRHHVAYGLVRINDEVRNWVQGTDGRPRSPFYLRGRDAVVWLRSFSDGPCDCGQLEEVLRAMPGVKRMVMGHTIQEEGINGVCGDRAIRIDVGLSKGCSNGMPEVLEISGGKDVKVLTSNPLYDQRGKYKVPVESGEGLAMLVRESRVKEVEAKA